MPGRPRARHPAGRARASRLEALAIYLQENDTLAIGRCQRWLSRLSWMLGDNADSERYAAAAITTLEPRGPGPELAMAYSNLSQLRMLAGDVNEAVRWGSKAIRLARRLGDRDTEIHALNNVGSSLGLAGDLAEGQARLAQSLDHAIASDAHEHAARAYNNLGQVSLDQRLFGDADKHLRAGVVDQQVDPGVPDPQIACGGADGIQRGQVEGLDHYVSAGGGADDSGRGALALLDVPHCQHHRSAPRGEDPGGLEPNTGVRAGDHS